MITKTYKKTYRKKRKKKTLPINKMSRIKKSIQSRITNRKENNLEGININIEYRVGILEAMDNMDNRDFWCKEEIRGVEITMIEGLSIKNFTKRTIIKGVIITIGEDKTINQEEIIGAGEIIGQEEHLSIEIMIMNKISIVRTLIYYKFID